MILIPSQPFSTDLACILRVLEPCGWAFHPRTCHSSQRRFRRSYCHPIPSILLPLASTYPFLKIYKFAHSNFLKIPDEGNMHA